MAINSDQINTLSNNKSFLRFSNSCPSKFSIPREWYFLLHHNIMNTKMRSGQKKQSRMVISHPLVHYTTIPPNLALVLAAVSKGDIGHNLKPLAVLLWVASSLSPKVEKNLSVEHLLQQAIIRPFVKNQG